jgi:hypothetical protein
MKPALLAAVVAATLLAAPLQANEAGPLVGTWKLVSFETEFQDGRPRSPQFGARPTGYLILTPQARLMTIIEAEGRKPATTDEERAALLRSMIAWTGHFRTEGDKLILKVDAAFNPAITGSERVSSFKMEGERMTNMTSWARSPVLPGAPVTRGVTVWERMK